MNTVLLVLLIIVSIALVGALWVLCKIAGGIDQIIKSQWR